MDEDATWYGSIDQHPPPTFRPMSIVATVAHLSYCCALVTSCNVTSCISCILFRQKYILHFHIFLRFRLTHPQANLYNGRKAVVYVVCISIINKAIVDYTSPALCTPITPFAADPIFSERSFVLLHDVIADRMIPFAASAL